MATIYSVMGELEKQIRAAVANVVDPAHPPALLPIKTGVGWPPVTALQNVARGGVDGPALITVYDRKVGRNTTRWSPFTYNQIATPSTLTTTVQAPQTIPGMGSTVIALGGVPVAGDAASAILSGPGLANQPGRTGAVVAQQVAGDTLAVFATRLAGLINADALLSTWVLASAVGGLITLTSLIGGPLDVQSFAGNGGTQLRELARRESQLQITIWAQTEQARAAIVVAVQASLAAAQVNFGVTTPDGTAARLEMQNDFPIEDDTLEDVYRHDFLVTADFAITTQDQLYAVLAPVPAFAVDFVIQ